jgi:hypothetical protein
MGAALWQWRSDATLQRRGANRHRASGPVPRGLRRGPASRECDRADSRDGATALPRTHASLHKTRTTASSRPCDRRPARDRVGDPRRCSRWGSSSGPERKPAYEAIVGAARHPSLLSGVSDRQLPVDGAMRMPRKEQPALARIQLTLAVELDEQRVRRREQRQRSRNVTK